MSDLGGWGQGGPPGEVMMVNLRFVRDLFGEAWREECVGRRNTHQDGSEFSLNS